MHGDEGRFWAKVQKLDEPHGCWIWLGGLNDRGYAIFHAAKGDNPRRQYKASAYSWYLYTGRHVPDGLFMCHHCDNPLCVNPQHLFLGTHVDNMQDMVEKDRQTKGEDSHLSKLTEVQVREIRLKYRRGVIGTKQLSELYGVSNSAVKFIVSNQTWKHVV